MNGMYHLLGVCRLGYPLSYSRLTRYGHVLGRRICRQESDEGAGGGEDRSGGGWITSRTTRRRDTCQGRKRKTGLNGGVS